LTEGRIASEERLPKLLGMSYSNEASTRISGSSEIAVHDAHGVSTLPTRFGRQ
jgi:hypothetical protein